ncbi:ribose 5-phosphate isomerase A [Tanacetum coccineum]
MCGEATTPFCPNKSPNNIEFFDLSYQSRDGSYIHGMSKDFMERAREEMTRRELEISKSRPVDDEVRAEIADAVMMDLIGPDKPGQALGYGTGVTKSKVTKLSLDLRRSRKESLVNQNRLLLEKLDSQGRRIESQNNQIKTMAKDLSDIRGELNVLTTAFKELYLAGASKDMFFQETSEDVQEEQQQQQQHQHNLNNLWQSLWQSSMQTPRVQNEQVSQSSQGQATRQQQSVLRQQRQQGQATRQPTQLDSMGQQVNATNMQQNPLTGQQYARDQVSFCRGVWGILRVGLHFSRVGLFLRRLGDERRRECWGGGGGEPEGKWACCDGDNQRGLAGRVDASVARGGWIEGGGGIEEEAWARRGRVTDERYAEGEDREVGSGAGGRGGGGEGAGRRSGDGGGGGGVRQGGRRRRRGEEG